MTRAVLYRILGNDLPPRHAAGQTLANLEFALRHEPPLEDCEKRWVLNRIADPAVEARVAAALEAHGQGYLRIPFIAAEYTACGIDFEGLPPKLYFHRAGFRALTPVRQRRLREWCFRRRTLYLMNNNGARNAALAEGRARAEWCCPSTATASSPPRPGASCAPGSSTPARRGT